MGRGDGDDDARLADLDAADAVVDRDAGQVVALADLGGDLLHHGLGHVLVGLVLEVQHARPARATRTVPMKVAIAPASSLATATSTASSSVERRRR